MRTVVIVLLWGLGCLQMVAFLGLLTIESQIASASMCIVLVREGIARRVDLPNNNNKNNDVPRSL